jgi:glutathione peroxidase-family protein
MYAHGRSLVKKFEGKPFAIVGVNSDTGRKKVKEVARKEKITWRSFWDGGSTEGPIQSQWNIQSYPTFYLIDHKGYIVARFWPQKQGEELIEQKVREAEAVLQK